ncbi:hypothetical protein EG68_10335 [Paragonimus skrjabini miyazakii]|uniref:NADH dehydrogenase (Ubiquinone) complex I, assembly factor 6 n=1 Tax=Paragonimus skrjabini miyazakii TaxID=59628 RepID=A0A8S9YGK3_9TREM|nr:hypothetical protein EG68_10335 [Paragonimus skrjabini miyazakii]
MVASSRHVLSPSAVMFHRMVRISSAFRSLSYSATVVRSASLVSNVTAFVENMIVKTIFIRDRVNNAEQANFRFQFWKDVIHNLFEPNQNAQYTSPIVENLRESMVGLRLSKFYFLQLIIARQRHFTECSFPTVKSAQIYAEETNTSVHYLISEAYDIRSIDVDHALNHLGRAQGLTALIRGAVPLARSRRVILLPLDMLDKHCINQEHLLRLLRAEPPSESTNVDQSLCDFFYDLACLAREQAVTAIRLATNILDQPGSQKIRADGRPSPETKRTRLLLPRLMLPLVPCLDYLTRLERTGHFDPRRVVGYDSNPLLPLRLAWTSWRGRIPRG